MTLTQPRVHIALAVSNLDVSAAFYERMFGLAPVKKRPGYAKFELTEPRLNFTLNETTEARAPGVPAHHGIELPTPADVASFALRVRGAGIESQPEDNVTCCYAVMDKIWMHDPDGHAWEVFAITQADVDSPPPVGPDVPEDAATEPGPAEPCCEPTCCT